MPRPGSSELGKLKKAGIEFGPPPDEVETKVKGKKSYEDTNGNVHIKVKVDGEEAWVKEDTVPEGYMRQADYTRKTQELKEREKQMSDNEPQGPFAILEEGNEQAGNGGLNAGTGNNPQETQGFSGAADGQQSPAAGQFAQGGQRTTGPSQGDLADLPEPPDPLEDPEGAREYQRKAMKMLQQQGHTLQQIQQFLQKQEQQHRRESMQRRVKAAENRLQDELPDFDLDEIDGFLREQIKPDQGQKNQEIFEQWRNSYNGLRQAYFEKKHREEGGEEETQTQADQEQEVSRETPFAESNRGTSAAPQSNNQPSGPAEHPEAAADYYEKQTTGQ